MGFSSLHLRMLSSISAVCELPSSLQYSEQYQSHWWTVVWRVWKAMLRIPLCIQIKAATPLPQALPRSKCISFTECVLVHFKHRLNKAILTLKEQHLNVCTVNVWCQVTITINMIGDLSTCVKSEFDIYKFLISSDIFWRVKREKKDISIVNFMFIMLFPDIMYPWILLTLSDMSQWIFLSPAALHSVDDLYG